MAEKVKQFQARYGQGGALAIISVLATNLESAKSEIVEQLGRNPSRRSYLAAWIRDGEIVVETVPADWVEA